MNLQEFKQQCEDDMKETTPKYIAATQGDLFKEKELNDIEVIYLQNKLITLQRIFKQLEILEEIERKYNLYTRYGSKNNRVEEELISIQNSQEESIGT